MAKEEDELTLTVSDPLVQGGDYSDLDVDLDALESMTIDTNGITFTVTPDYDPRDNMIDFKFDEDMYIDELLEYIKSTYNSHYSKNRLQSTEVIIDRGHGTGFCMGNVDKYSNRYGKKGTADDARKDLMKILHYALIQLYVHDNDL